MLGVDQVGPVSPDRPIGLGVLAAKAQPFLDLSPLPFTARPERTLLTWSSSLGHSSSSLGLCIVSLFSVALTHGGIVFLAVLHGI